MILYRVIKRTFFDPSHPARWAVQWLEHSWTEPFAREKIEVWKDVGKRFDSKAEAIAYVKEREGWNVAREKEVYRSE